MPSDLSALINASAKPFSMPSIAMARDPDSCPSLQGAYRYIRARRFPYLLIFNTQPGGEIFVVALAHTSRRPGYWRRRT